MPAIGTMVNLENSQGRLISTAEMIPTFLPSLTHKSSHRYLRSIRSAAVLPSGTCPLELESRSHRASSNTHRRRPLTHHCAPQPRRSVHHLPGKWNSDFPKN